MTEAALAPARAPRAPWWAWIRPAETRWLAVLLGTLVLVVCQWRYGILGTYEVLPVALGSCMLTEIVLSLVTRHRVPSLQSAYMSGISMSLLLRPQAGLLWPFAVCAVITIASKYALQYRGKHLWCPTDLSISLLLLLAPESVAVLSHQWGNDLPTNLVIWTFGIYVAWRAKIFHITVTYVAAFVAFALLRSVMMGLPVLPEIAPVTGPMYQLFVFFMITDPRTNVSSRRGRILVAVLVALMEALIRLMADTGVPLLPAVYAAPPLFALAIVGPIAKFIDLRRTRARPEPTNLTGWGVARPEQVPAVAGLAH